MQTIWNFQRIKVSYKNKKWRCQSFLNSQPRETGMHSINISPLITMKSKMYRSVLDQLQFNQVFLCSTWPYDWTIIKIKLDPAGFALWNVVSKKQSISWLRRDLSPSLQPLMQQETGFVRLGDVYPLLNCPVLVIPCPLELLLLVFSW